MINYSFRPSWCILDVLVCWRNHNFSLWIKAVNGNTAKFKFAKLSRKPIPTVNPKNLAVLLYTLLYNTLYAGRVRMSLWPAAGQLVLTALIMLFGIVIAWQDLLTAAGGIIILLYVLTAKWPKYGLEGLKEVASHSSPEPQQMQSYNLVWKTFGNSFSIKSRRDEQFRRVKAVGQELICFIS